MSVRPSPYSFAPLFTPFRLLGPPSAPDSAENAKLSAEVDKMFRDYQMGSDTSPQANVSRYLTQVQKAIFAKIDQPQSYQGKNAPCA
jgi:colicin import membrane protein